MRYKYRRGQIFRKPLPVSKQIKTYIYNNELPFSLYLENALEDKVPISCLCKKDRKIVSRFGIEKSKDIDWELLNKDLGYHVLELYSLLEHCSLDNANQVLYAYIQDRIAPALYSEKMKKFFPKRFIDVSTILDKDLKDVVNRFNTGEASLHELISYWSFFKDKDWYYFFVFNNYSFVFEDVIHFMEAYEELVPILLKTNQIGYFIGNCSRGSIEEQKNFLGLAAISIIENAENYYGEKVDLTEEDYKVLYKYISINDYLQKYLKSDPIYEELQSLSMDEVLEVFRIDFFKDRNVVHFLNTFGVAEVLAFEKNCGPFLTLNNCLLLKCLDLSYYTGQTFSSFLEAFIIKSLASFDGRINHSVIHGEFRDRHPHLFIPTNAPDALQKAFYSYQVDLDYVINHPQYRDYLKNIDVEFLVPSIYGPVARNQYVNFLSLLKEHFSQEEVFSIVLTYGKYFYLINEKKLMQDANQFTKDNLISVIKKIKCIAITELGMFYNEDLAQEEGYRRRKSLFLPENTDASIKEKFYNKKFKIEDFVNDPDLLEIFTSTNVIYGFPPEYMWAYSLFTDNQSMFCANQCRLRAIQGYLELKDCNSREKYVELMKAYGIVVGPSKVGELLIIIQRISLSNARELFKFRKMIVPLLLKNENPLETLDLLENIFVENKLPTVGKIYLCFQILYPDFKTFVLDNNKMSPVLDKSSSWKKRIIIFSDLIRATLGSGNRSLLQFLNHLKEGAMLYDKVRFNGQTEDDLSRAWRETLENYASYLTVLYHNTFHAKSFAWSGSILEDIDKLYQLFGVLDDKHNIVDRLVNMFCHFAGFKTLNDIDMYLNSRMFRIDKKNRGIASHKFLLEKGDFIKGIYKSAFRGILQNGCVSNEFLGENAKSDSTPLDTDVSIILKDLDTNTQMIYETVTGNSYGDVFLVLKNDQRFICTRDEKKTKSFQYDEKKLEVFYSGKVGESHYGIRTGFASTDIDAILTDSYESWMGLEIARNGFYIPIFNLDGDVLFSPEDFDYLRNCMQGLSFYGGTSYSFSPHLINEDTIQIVNKMSKSNDDIVYKKDVIFEHVTAVLTSLGWKVETSLNNLSQGVVQFINTGSTGRKSNMLDDSDFDYVLRLDRNVYEDKALFQEVKNKFLQYFSNYISVCDEAKALKFKGLKIADIAVDVDITFAPKTPDLIYSSDDAMLDRFNTLKNLDEEKYNFVLANIILAKQLLKEANVYKAYKSDHSQGGLGGLGIENWIVQHGGSFYDAAVSFLEAANGKDLKSFQISYPIWDFGENHLSSVLNIYPHDNFVHHLSSDGYQKMCTVLKAYVDNYTRNGHAALKKSL